MNKMIQFWLEFFNNKENRIFYNLKIILNSINEECGRTQKRKKKKKNQFFFFCCLPFKMYEKRQNGHLRMLLDVICNKFIILFKHAMNACKSQILE